MNEMVTITREEYDRLREAADDLADIEAFDRAKADGEESIPDEFVGRILDGESPVRVYRDLRQLSQARLAELAGVHRVTVAEIETGRKNGSVATLRAIATALGVGMDDLEA